MSSLVELSAAVAGFKLPEGLKATVEVVVSADWHDLLGYVAKCYGGTNSVSPCESPNDTDYTADANTISAYSREYIENERSKLVQYLLDGDLEVYYFGEVIEMAVIDGHLPAGKYIASVSW